MSISPRAFVRRGAVTTLLLAIALSAVPLSPAPASADDGPGQPAALDDEARRQDEARRHDLERHQKIVDEQKRHAEHRRDQLAHEASQLWREVERESERLHREAAGRGGGQAKHAGDASSSTLTTTTAEAVAIVALRPCTDSTTREVLVPSGGRVRLVAIEWFTKNQGLSRAFTRGTTVNATIGGVPVTRAEQFFLDPAPVTHPTLGEVWTTRWEYTFTGPVASALLVQVRWSLDHQMVDLVTFDEAGQPVHFPAGFGEDLSCTLRPAVPVSGRITGEGAGLPDAEVTARDAVTFAFRGGSGTDSNGEFALLLQPGSYKFFFRDRVGPWVPEWWENKSSSFEATTVTLAFGQVAPRLLVDLERGVFLSGLVSDAETNQGVAGVSVRAQRDICCEGFGAETDPAGGYRMVVRKNVQLRVSFFPQPGAIPYLEQWWNARPSFQEADLLPVGTIDVAGIDARLERGVFVRGRVTDAETGQPLAGANVSASAVNVVCCQNFFASTDAQGMYAMAVRKNLTIKVGFFPPASPIPYVPDFWRGKRSFAEADPLVLGTVNISGIDGALERGVFLRGRVTEAETSLAIPNVPVSAQTFEGFCCENFFAFTDAQGNYAMVVRRNVSVKVGFSAPFNSPKPYLPEWWNDKRSFQTADVLLIGSADVFGIDAALERGVFLRGRVTDGETGAGIANAGVSAQRVDVACCEFLFAFTDAQGNYAMVVRRNVSLRVGFFPPFNSPRPYLGEWWNDKRSFQTADVLLIGSADVSGIDAALELGVFVRGRVTDAETGTGIANASVSGQRVDVPCCESFFAGTDPSGNYAMAVRRNVAVKVTFFPPFNSPRPYLGEWWNDKRNFQTADVLLIGSADVFGIDAALERGVFLRGRVTDGETGAGIANAGVNAQRVDVACCEFFFAGTDPGGNYAMAVRRNVAVKVTFFPPFNSPRPYLTELWNNKRNFQSADVLLIGSADVSGIDAALEVGVFMRGRVTDAETGTGIASASVNAQRVDVACCEFFFAGTDPGGNYVMVVRRNVSLKVGFFPPFNSPRPYLGEWWNDKRSFQSADVLLIGSADVSGIDAALEVGVFVRGRVTDAETSLAIPNVPVGAQTFEGVCCENFFAFTDSQGRYNMVVRQNLRLKLFFSPPFGTAVTYVGQWWSGKRSFQTADVLVVGSADVSGIDAALERGVRLSGRVTDAATGLGVGGVNVSVQAPVCCEGITGAQTVSDGTYSVVVRPGSYKVGFFPQPGSDLLSEFYNNKPGFDTADVVVVGATGVSGIDAVLDRRVRLSGRLTDAATGLPIDGARVYVHEATCCQVVVSVTTAPDGTYSVLLLPGSYKVRFVGPVGPFITSPYAAEFYDNKLTFELANVVTLAPGVPLGNIDAALDIVPMVPTPTVLELTPAFHSKVVNNQARLSAKVTADPPFGSTTRQPVPEVHVTFFVDGAGPNRDLIFTGTTNASGETSIEYTRAFAVSDTVTAYVTSRSSTLDVSTVEWVNAQPLSVTPDDSVTLANNLCRTYTATAVDPMTGAPRVALSLSANFQENMGLGPLTDQDGGATIFGISPSRFTSVTLMATDANGRVPFDVCGAGVSTRTVTVVVFDNASGGDFRFLDSGDHSDAGGAISFVARVPTITVTPEGEKAEATNAQRVFSVSAVDQFGAPWIFPLRVGSVENTDALAGTSTSAIIPWFDNDAALATTPAAGCFSAPPGTIVTSASQVTVSPNGEGRFTFALCSASATTGTPVVWHDKNFNGLRETDEPQDTGGTTTWVTALGSFTLTPTADTNPTSPDATSAAANDGSVGEHMVTYTLRDPSGSPLRPTADVTVTFTVANTGTNTIWMVSCDGSTTSTAVPAGASATCTAVITTSESSTNVEVDTDKAGSATIAASASTGNGSATKTWIFALAATITVTPDDPKTEATNGQRVFSVTAIDQFGAPWTTPLRVGTVENTDALTGTSAPTIISWFDRDSALRTAPVAGCFFAPSGTIPVGASQITVAPNSAGKFTFAICSSSVTTGTPVVWDDANLNFLREMDEAQDAGGATTWAAAAVTTFTLSPLSDTNPTSPDAATAAVNDGSIGEHLVTYNLRDQSGNPVAPSANVTVTFTMTNTGADPIYLVSCDGASTSTAIPAGASATCTAVISAFVETSTNVEVDTNRTGSATIAAAASTGNASATKTWILAAPEPTTGSLSGTVVLVDKGRNTTDGGWYILETAGGNFLITYATTERFIVLGVTPDEAFFEGALSVGDSVTFTKGTPDTHEITANAP